MMNFISSAIGKFTEENEPSTAAPTPRSDEELMAEMEKLKQQAYEACMADIGQCLNSYLAKTGTTGTYEGWISEMHPENLKHGKIDHRFYLKDSEYRVRWNEKVDQRRFVYALDPAGNVVVDPDDGINWSEWDFCEGFKPTPRTLPPRIVVAPAVRVFPKRAPQHFYNTQQAPLQTNAQVHTPPMSAQIPIRRRVVVRPTMSSVQLQNVTLTTTPCGWTLVN
mmetsp:Transcript_45615/g.98498  ORF Transcript_45615/g.98498 Transcript_45615/m.98498 type:complete len:222 (-) Transcript_45615:61-726(-)|eukprot:CAMPEP_0206562890 /NCGR_PEP_ID=MMETSP0325_2-20121206/22525_1 /ASSEMBLY_ACC=CAM_ASM_000347 /TAXON_ID=2866 /ORGANISM="Crypthecodinium cohnii, Strain Seligo" /LENGTH=221 /DNA_ID=CAMNT_0054065201 /DNA_START=307 /DNA_END=972 /DNA_ORIENTATION=+